MDLKEKQYESIHKYQFHLMQMAHKAKTLDYKVKMLTDFETGKNSCIIIYSKDLSLGALYISAAEFIKLKAKPVYRIGVVQFDATNTAHLYDYLYVAKLNRTLDEYIALINEDVSFSDSERRKILSFLSSSKDFIRWANSMNMKVFIRKYKTDDEHIVCTTNY